MHADAGEVLVKHGDIPNFMPGMTMPFKVRPPATLEPRQPGDLIRAVLRVTETEAWLESVTKTGTAAVDNAPAMPAAAFTTPLTPGDLAPDTALQDHLGRTLRLSDWHGSAVAITFIYIRCPLPQFCPLLDRRFAELQQLVLRTADLRGRARLLSVSFDPDADTRERLQTHADRLGASPDIWRFASAPRDTVDRFAATFGVNVIREPDQTITHSMRTAVIGPDGRVRRIFEGREWSAGDLASEMQRTLASPLEP